MNTDIKAVAAKPHVAEVNKAAAKAAQHAAQATQAAANAEAHAAEANNCQKQAAHKAQVAKSATGDKAKEAAVHTVSESEKAQQHQKKAKANADAAHAHAKKAVENATKAAAHASAATGTKVTVPPRVTKVPTAPKKATASPKKAPRLPKKAPRVPKKAQAHKSAKTKSPELILQAPEAQCQLQCSVHGDIPVWISSLDTCAIQLASEYDDLDKNKDDQEEFKARVQKECSHGKDEDVLRCIPRDDVLDLIMAGFCSSKDGTPALNEDGRLMCSRNF